MDYFITRVTTFVVSADSREEAMDKFTSSPITATVQADTSNNITVDDEYIEMS